MSDKSLARLAGGLVLSLVFLGPFALLYVPSVVTVPGDAAATVAALQENAALATAGTLGELAIAGIEVVLSAALLVLFWPAGRFLAATMAGARATMAVLQFGNTLPALLATALATGTVAGVDPATVELLVGLSAPARELGVVVWQFPFALHLVALGALVWRSGRVPQLFAPGLVLAGLAYAAHSLVIVFLPELAETSSSVVAMAAMLGELPAFLWMLAFGVRAEGGGARPAAASGVALAK